MTVPLFMLNVPLPDWPEPLPLPMNTVTLLTPSVPPLKFNVAFSPPTFASAMPKKLPPERRRWRSN